jgi:hypothetical protein
MADAKAQVHGRFKAFAGTVEAGGSIAALAAGVEAFVRERGVAAKSIGVEYLESLGKLVLTLGYRDDEPAYPVTLHSRPCGRADDLSDLSELERRMEDAAAGLSDVICHELFATDDGEFVMVFMTRA